MAVSPRLRANKHSETSVRTYAKLRKSELDLEKECSRLEQQMVNRLVSKEREIQRYISESSSQQLHSKTQLRRSGSDTADKDSNRLGPPSSGHRQRSLSASEMTRSKSSSSIASPKPHVRSSAPSQSPRPGTRKKMSPTLPISAEAGVGGGDGRDATDYDKESQVRAILSGEPLHAGTSPETAKRSPSDSSLPALVHDQDEGAKKCNGSPRNGKKPSSGDTSIRSTTKGVTVSRAHSVNAPVLTQPSVRSSSLPAVIPTILVDDEVEREVSDSPEGDAVSQDGNCSSTEASPQCSPGSSPAIKHKSLRSSSAEALTDAKGSTSNVESLAPVQRNRTKSASGPRTVSRVKSCPADSIHSPDKKTLLEMSKHLPNMKGKDGFKQFYQASSPKQKRKHS